MRDALADSPVVAVKFPRIAVGAEPRGGATALNFWDMCLFSGDLTG